jgi:hypothetical protein
MKRKIYCKLAERADEAEQNYRTCMDNLRQNLDDIQLQEDEKGAG